MPIKRSKHFFSAGTETKKNAQNIPQSLTTINKVKIYNNVIRFYEKILVHTLPYVPLVTLKQFVETTIPHINFK